MPNLAFYLRKILNQEPINYSQFVRECEKQSLQGWQKVFQFKQLHKQNYEVDILEPVQFEAWCKLYLQLPQNRIAASKIGNSHQQRVSANYLLRCSPNQAPGLVWLSKDNNPPSISAPNALILENLENFAHIQEMQHLLHQWLPLSAEQSFDWLFGAGNQISNQLNRAYLAQYQRIYCLFDWDLGGLQIFRNLQLMLPAQRLQFVLPEEPRDLLRSSLRPLPLAQRSKLMELQHLSAETDKLIQALLETEKRLEQEIYLIEKGD